MGRVAVVLLAVVGLLLAAAGLIAALAWGLPALGLNRLGRNPVDETVRGLAFAAALYAAGAALLASATRWLRSRYGPLSLAAFAYAAALIPVLCVWMAVLAYWSNIPLLLFIVVGIYAPVAIGGRPWGKQLRLGPGS
jgi:MFS family permease